MNAQDPRDDSSFFRLLTTTSREQRVAVLKNITKKQCQILRHLAYNIMFNSSFDLTEEDRKYLKKNAKSIKGIASKKVCIDSKKDIFAKKQLLVKKLAQLGLRYLE